MKRFACILVVLSLYFYGVEAQEITVSALLDTTKIYIGDQIGYTVTLDMPLGTEARLPQLSDTLIGGVEIIGAPTIDTIDDNSRRQIVNRYIVTSFDSGHYVLPPIYAEINDSHGVQRFYSDFLPLEVVRINIAPADTTLAFYDIVAPRNAPVRFEEVVPWVLIILLALVVGYGIYKIIYRVVKRDILNENAATDTVKEAAHVIAFRELEILHSEELWQQGDIKNYYTRLTDILRQYLDNRWGIGSMEMTTSETLEQMRRVGFKQNDENYRFLKLLLEDADLVKFAKYNPNDNLHEVQYDNTRRFVELTMERGEEEMVSATSINNSAPTDEKRSEARETRGNVQNENRGTI